jgi:anthranilate synthase/aminodeoxychorismate synthase-like glutamine amidotransferase
MILVIDNYDSFVHNLARYVRELGGDPLVIRNDAIDLPRVRDLSPSHVILSPGPQTPHEAGISNDLIAGLPASTPLLGVCLGHQCIGEVFGGRIVRAKRPMHGKVGTVVHDGAGIFSGLPPVFQGTRYHSLAIEKTSLPPVLTITAVDEDGEIMAVAHRARPIVGVQFHPESILTEHGHDLLANFLRY